MARSTRSRNSRSTTIRVTEFRWPAVQLYVWLFIVLTTCAVLIGVFASFIQVQSKMGLGQPWLFPYGVTTGCLTLLFLVLLLALSTNDALTPGICILFCLVLFTLYLTGLIETGVQLFGNGNVAQNCQTYVDNVNIVGPGVNTLAWLEENNICNAWYAAFTFWLIGAIVFAAMMGMAAQVGSGAFD